MKIVITIKDKKNIDSTVDKVLDIGSMLEKKFRGFRKGKLKARCYKDGTMLIMER